MINEDRCKRQEVMFGVFRSYTRTRACGVRGRGVLRCARQSESGMPLRWSLPTTMNEPNHVSLLEESTPFIVVTEMWRETECMGLTQRRVYAHLSFLYLPTKNFGQAIALLVGAMSVRLKTLGTTEVRHSIGCELSAHHMSAIGQVVELLSHD